MGSVHDEPYGVKVLADGTDPIVDVVAVHGLDGHPEKTWTAKNGVLWLRDSLPKVIPNIRILSYGYDGRTHGSTFSCQNLYDHAISLITELTLFRTETKTNERPIIFVAHDIGGLIVKEALIHSDSVNEDNLEHHHSIKTSTYGILFFGTPHQGSDILACPPKIRALLQSRALFHNTNEAISKNLEVNSELLQKQLGQYKNISSRFVTKCFYETNKSPLYKETTVRTSSAVVPGATNVEVFSINADHEGMVKYKSAGNDAFKKVSSCLKLMVGDDALEEVSERWKEWNRLKAARGNGVQVTFEIPFEPEYPRNQHFSGRKDLLGQLHQTIQAQKALCTVVLYGTGGIGKTQIASEYAHAHQHEYTSVFWIHGATKQSIQQGFRTAAQRLVKAHGNVAYDINPNYELISKNLVLTGAVDEAGFVSTHQDQNECIVRAVKLWLAKEGNQNWLLIFDNVDDLSNSDIEKFVPTAPHGTVIMTSRRTDCAGFGTGLPVEEMQEQEAETLLLKSAGLAGDPLAGDLVRTLGSLPLAIVQAGAYISVSQMPLTRYLGIYHECFNNIFEHKPCKATWHYGDRTVRTTWEISFKAIKDTSTEAAELLSLCSFFSNEDILDTMIRRGKGLGQNDLTLDNWLRLLFSYSLAQRKGSDDSFYIHPVVHLWAHERLHPDDRVRKTEEALEVVSAGIKSPDAKELHDWGYEGRILQHIVATAKYTMRYLNTRLLNSHTIGEILCLGSVLCDRGYLGEAEGVQLQAVESICVTLGEQHPCALMAMNNLAGTYHLQGRYNEAVGLELQVLKGREITQGKEHPDTLMAMNNLATTYHSQGRYNEAEKFRLQVLKGREITLGKEHPDTLMAMNNLAVSYDTQGRYNEAERFKLQVLKGMEITLGKEHPDTLTAMNNLAATYHSQGRYNEAEKFHLQVLKGREITLGKEHPDTLIAMNNLAATYHSQGRYNEAEELELQVVELHKRVWGEDHPETLMAIKDLNGIQQRKRGVRWDTGFRGMQSHQSLALHDDPALEMAIARSLQPERSGDGGRAEVLDQDDPLALVDHLAAALGEMHPETISTIARMVVALSDEERWEEAEKLQLRLVNMSQSVLGGGHPTTLRAMSIVAMTYMKQDRLKEAEGVLIPLVEAMQRIQGRDHEDTISLTKILAEIYRRQGRQVEAAKLVRGSANRGSGMGEANTDEEMLQEAIKVSLQPEGEGEGSSDRGRKLDKKRPGVLKIMANKAATDWDLGEWEKAEQLELKVMRTRKMTLGKEDPSTLLAMTNLAGTYRDQGQREQAEKLEAEVIDIMKATDIIGTTHPGALAAISTLAATHIDQGNWEEAGELYLKVVHARIRCMGKEHPRTLSAMAVLATNHWQQGELELAEKLELKVVAGRRKKLGNEDPDTLTAISNLAATYAGQDRYDEAEELQEEVFQALLRTRGDGHVETISAQELLQLYRQGGVVEEGCWWVRKEVVGRLVGKMVTNVFIFLLLSCFFLVSFSFSMLSYLFRSVLPILLSRVYGHEATTQRLREVRGLVARIMEWCGDVSGECVLGGDSGEGDFGEGGS